MELFMADLSFEEMQRIQKELQEKYKDKWQGISPQVARDKLLWMMIEAGEMADIIKKEGDEAIMQEPETRKHFVEEICDVLMYLNDVMLCYEISPSDLHDAYLKKHQKTA
jgi:NTP pyrophosphatase (non-canonical NTP hydrolase)